MLYQIVHVEPDKGERVFSIKKENERVIISTDNSKAKYIWGDNYLDPDSDIYINLARTVPDANWKLEYYGHALNGGDGCTSYMEADYASGILEFRKECYVDERTIPDLVSDIKGLDDLRSVSFDEFRRFFNVDDSISEDYYNKYKDCVVFEGHDEGDYFIFNPETKTVRSHHTWVIANCSIK